MQRPRSYCGQAYAENRILGMYAAGSQKQVSQNASLKVFFKSTFKDAFDGVVSW